MVAIVRAGVNFSDPREFDRSIMASSALYILDSGTTATASNTAGFATEVGNRGITDDTNWTADTYKTILSISSGMGIVLGMYGPTGLAGTPTTTFEITVDGVLNTIAVVATAITQRAYLGALMDDQAGAFFTTAKEAYRGPDSVSADKTTTKYGAVAGMAIPPVATARLFGTPGLIYRTSLLIRMKSSESNSTTTNKERQSGIIYKVMA